MDQLILKNNSDNWLQDRATHQNQTATFLEEIEDSVTVDTEINQQATNLFAGSPQISSAAHPSTSGDSRVKRSRNIAATQANPSHQSGHQLVSYKFIKLTKLGQLEHFKDLITLKTWEHLQYRQNNLNIVGIVAEIDNKKVGLVLAEVTPNNLVARTISLMTDSECGTKTIVRLIQCLEKSLHQQNCRRIIWHKQAKVLKRRFI